MRLNPDLEEMEGICSRWIEFRVGNARACAHELDFTGL